jgi:uncharacterized protein (DUF2336 family)
MASGAQALIAELDASLAKRSDEQRSTMLRRICDLFLVHAEVCPAEQVSIFDDVMMRLLGTLPRAALIELSGKLAAVNNAPSNVARRLASDDDIAIAGPLLTRSNALTDRDLAVIVAEKGASHLKAVLSRGPIGEAVTDLLLERNDPELLSRLAANEEARFSEVGIVKLIYAAKNDKALVEIVLGRKDLPAEMLPFLQMADGAS